jgi:heme oxygenase
MAIPQFLSLSLLPSTKALQKRGKAVNTLGLHSRLKRGTQILHSELDNLPSLRRLLEPRLTPGHYFLALQGFHALVQPYEKALQASPGWLEGCSVWRTFLRAHLLEKDLNCLAQRPELISLNFKLPFVTSKVPSLSEIRPIQSLAIAYVLFGSTLGGLSIARMVGRTLSSYGINSQFGISYFSSSGPETLAHWRTFAEFLDAIGNTLSEIQKQEIVTFAQEFFQIWTHHFKTWPFEDEHLLTCALGTSV